MKNHLFAASKRLKLVMLFLSITLLSSCAFHNGLSSNQNNNTTEVVLAKKNYKVIASVQGESQATYVFGIGGLSKKAMIAEARANMLSKANIIGGSKAIINEIVEVKHTAFPIVQTHKVIVSAFVIEFTE
jgi:hypothetical protein